jgi:GH15 family glucan-1,4-alpha-glucosidase
MRTDGYAAIEDYAVIGDGRTAALASRDGSIDWLCLPDFDSTSIFARVLDAERGGHFAVTPTDEFETERRYREGSNVLETTFRTAGGSARVTDALTLSEGHALAPLRELARRLEGLDGEIELEWVFEPRPGYARAVPELAPRGGRLACGAGRLAFALSCWGIGEPTVERGRAGGGVTLRGGDSALLSVACADREPLVFAGRDEIETRLDGTDAFWRRWSDRTDYEGRWADAVRRSALALKLLVFAPSGAIVAAPTASLPEWIGGERNWDYRFAWVRDASFTLVTLEQLGYRNEANAFFWWLSHATALTHPRLQVLYRLTGGTEMGERTLGHLDGYRGSTPVRVGNAASGQTQLDVYGPMLDAVWQHAGADADVEGLERKMVAKIADWVADHWRDPDSGIWESRDPPTHYTQSKVMCWVALDRACRLAANGVIPDHSDRWRAEADAIEEFVEQRCWDDDLESYVRATDLRVVDASLLTLPLFGFGGDDDEHVVATVAAVERDLQRGALVHRYPDRKEGAFVACSFWLASALARIGRIDEAVSLVDELLELANDVGLWAEEIDENGAFLGNFPQALSHLAFVNAAVDIARVEEAA